MKALAIVPARGGSKGVPRKNIRSVGGRPLLDYALECANLSQKLSATVVSSDDTEILDQAARWPGVRALRRPDELATDASPVVDTVQHVIDAERADGREYDCIVLLQATAPMREPWHVDEAIELLVAHPEAQSVVSVTELREPHPSRMYWRDDDGLLVSMLPQYEQRRRQDVPPVLYRNGALYIVRTGDFERTRSLMIKPTLPYVMSDRYLLNIDERRDMLLAELLIPEWQQDKCVDKA
jgi:CMP-N,N'-diacetyllegionaminic acid synthase